jgi:hypothetical protein
VRIYPNNAAKYVLWPCRFKVPIVNTYNQTVGMYFGHITDRPIPGRELDCGHYCSPGVPEVTVQVLCPCFVLSTLFRG